MSVKPNPCAECPFHKKSLPGYVGGHDDIAEIDALIQQDQKFPCHMATNSIKEHLLNELGGDEEDQLAMSDEQAFFEATQQAPHCTGALQYMNNSCKRSRDARTQALQDAVGKNPDVFRSKFGLFKHHKSKHYDEVSRLLTPEQQSALLAADGLSVSAPKRAKRPAKARRRK
jgi:hypothetical protein